MPQSTCKVVVFLAICGIDRSALSQFLATVLYKQFKKYLTTETKINQIT